MAGLVVYKVGGLIVIGSLTIAEEDPCNRTVQREVILVRRARQLSEGIPLTT